MATTSSCCCSSSSSSQEDYQNIISDMISVEGISHVDDMISYIERLLNEERNVSKEVEVDSSIKSAGALLNKVLKRSKRHICKREFKRKVNRETRKLMIDVANEAAQIKWLGVALSVVANVLERIEQVSSNTEECIKLLKYMCDLAKYIKKLNERLPQEKLNRVLQFIVEGSALCISQIKSDSYFSKCLAAPVTAEDLQSLRRDLEHEYSDLSLEAIIAVLNRSEEILNTNAEILNRTEDILNTNVEILSRNPVVLPPSQGIAPQAVGIEESRKHVTQLLDMRRESVIAVVIYGQGGIGKTTLATAVFNKLDLKSYKFCRVDMQQYCSESDLKKLQQQILRDVFNRNIELRSLEEGRVELSTEFTKATAPLFIFVDNALRESDFEKLLPITDLKFLPQQSRILVTTRNLNETRIILQAGNIQRCSYLVPVLSREKAHKLLCEFALGDRREGFDPTVDINGLLQICQGVPLVLKLAGARLRENAENVEACSEAVEYLKSWLLQGEEGELSEHMVDFVYNRLGGSCKEAFLDIVFFFGSWKRRKVSYIVGEIELQELERAALVNITSRRRVNVHDIVQARGKRLSPDGERLTDKQSLTDELENEERLKKIKGIQLDEAFSLEACHLSLMKRCLRVVIVSEVNGEWKGVFENLRFLSLQKRNESLMDFSNHPKLAVFESRCEFSGVPSALKYMRLQEATLANVSTTFSRLQSLRVLKLWVCKGFDYLPETFWNLPALEKLDVRDCPSLESLPVSFGNLRSLRDLRLAGCRQLSALPESFGNLASLESLSFDRCFGLSQLPHNFGQLKRLKYLNICGCSHLQILSGDFECLTSLIAVDASYCPELEGHTMDKLAKMKGLMIVNIYNSGLLKERWEQVKEQYSLAVMAIGYRPPVRIPYEDVTGRTFFHRESKLVHVEENGQFVESPPPAGAVVELSVLLTVCDLTSEGNRGYLEAVRKEWEEVGSGKMKVIVDMGVPWEESGRRARETLPLLPGGTRAWIAPDNRASLLFAYSLFKEGRTEYDEPTVITNITCTRRDMNFHDFIIPDYTPHFEYTNLLAQLLSPISEARTSIHKPIIGIKYKQLLEFAHS